jgi:hypothetical protein
MEGFPAPAVAAAVSRVRGSDCAVSPAAVLSEVQAVVDFPCRVSFLQRAKAQRISRSIIHSCDRCMNAGTPLKKKSRYFEESAINFLHMETGMNFLYPSISQWCWHFDVKDDSWIREDFKMKLRS